MIVDKSNENNLNTDTECMSNLKEPKDLESTVNVDESINIKDDKVIELENKLVQMKEDERDTILRFTAEIENIRRRHIQEIERAHKFSLERFISELLPVIDNLERTLNIIDRSNADLSAIVEGVDLTLKSFLDTVYKFGVESIYDVNVLFNPEIHQAISTVESEEDKPNQVLSIIQKGYLLNGRLIRPAMVTVSKQKLNN